MYPKGLPVQVLFHKMRIKGQYAVGPSAKCHVCLYIVPSSKSNRAHEGVFIPQATNVRQCRESLSGKFERLTHNLQRITSGVTYDPDYVVYEHLGPLDFTNYPPTSRFESRSCSRA